MRRLMLLRHAKTERAEPGQRDRDRVLTARGRADAPVIGGYMAKYGLVPDLAMISPAARAQETWKLIAPCFARVPRVANDGRLYDATPAKLAEIVRETKAASSVLIVGHNPSLHDFAMQMIASGDVEMRERIKEKLPTSGLVIIDFSLEEWPRLLPHTGRIERFVSPRLIGAATD